MLLIPRYGLSWSPVAEGHIISASEDGTVAHWDVGQYDKTSPTISPLRKYTGHAGYVGDVDWHHTQPHTFASAGDDRRLMM